MADTTQETLLEHFRAIALDLNTAASATMSGSDTRAGITGADTSIPVVGNPPLPTAASSGSSGESSPLSLAAEVFGSGLGVVSLATGLMGLFGGSSGPPPLTKYAMPQSLDFTGIENGSGIAGGSFDQLSTPRIAGAAADTSSTASSNTASGAGSPTPSNSPQISVTVQAMDAQSFLDRSNDIAQAVRQAMLNSSSINDVVSDL